MSKEAEEYLASRGLKNAIYSIDAADVQEDLFGHTVTCPFRVRYFIFQCIELLLSFLSLVKILSSLTCSSLFVYVTEVCVLCG